MLLTRFLWQRKWVGAKEDLEKALNLEREDESYVSAILLVNLGNAEGALGDWDSAMEKFTKAGFDPDVGEIARANHALALFQVRTSGSTSCKLFNIFWNMALPKIALTSLTSLPTPIVNICLRYLQKVVMRL